MEREWKLGEDLFESDFVIDPLTFEEIIMTLHAGSKEINEKEVYSVFRYIVECRMMDAEFLLQNNMEEIIRRSKHYHEE